MGLLIEDVRVPATNALLAGTLLSPKQPGPHPGVLLVTGSGANDRDETVCGHTPFRIIAEYLAGRGFAVLRCDDRGVGASTGDAGEQDFDGAVADVVSAYTWLAGQACVDAGRVAILGHSEGGLSAAAAGPLVGAWAIVMLAGPASPIEAMLHEQARTISVELGATAAQIDHERRMNERVFALARSDKDRTEVQSELEALIQQFLRSWPDVERFDEAAIVENAKVMAEVVIAPAYRSLLRQEPAAILGRCDSPLLAVYGGKDMQVPGAENMEAFRGITAGCQRASALLFPEHNHLFQRAVTGAISEYESLPPGPDVVVLRAVADWLSTVEPGAAPDPTCR